MYRIDYIYPKIELDVILTDEVAIEVMGMTRWAFGSLPYLKKIACI